MTTKGNGEYVIISYFTDNSCKEPLFFMGWSADRPQWISAESLALEMTKMTIAEQMLAALTAFYAAEPHFDATKAGYAMRIIENKENTDVDLRATVFDK